jgi:tellurite resistance protein TerC
MIGVAIGILTMRFAAGIFSYAVTHQPILKPAAYVLVLIIGVELILEQVWHVQISDLLRFAISVSTLLLALAYAHSGFLQRFRFVLTWLAQGIGIINELVDWILAPLRGLLRFIGLIFKSPSKTETA